MLKRIFFQLILFTLWAFPINALIAQNDEGFIYGKITSYSGTVYEGQIRWGKEESFWNDIFNATKTSQKDNTYEKLAPEKRSKNWWENLDGSILKIWDDEYSSQNHQFTCRFGDIKAIYPEGESQVKCEFKNGLKLTLIGGSNDFGTTIVINDYELGIVKLRWNNIRKIEFKDTPEELSEKFGKPLYGNIQTSEGKLTGYVQWDKHERIDTDLLQGSSNAGKLEIAFRKISCIENQGNKSLVTLKGGKKIIMYGSNDVNSENRGIIVSTDDIGKIEVPWSRFLSVCFDEEHKASGAPYASYNEPKRLYGIVKDLSGDEFGGLIIFDRDEKWNFEQLEGIHNDLKYIIPFKNIKTIIPKNDDYSYIILKNNEKFLLGKLQDVSSKNEGVVVISSNSDSKFIDWTEVDEINFE